MIALRLAITDRSTPRHLIKDVYRDRGLFLSKITSELTARSLRLSSLQLYDSSFTVRVSNADVAYCIGPLCLTSNA